MEPRQDLHRPLLDYRQPPVRRRQSSLFGLICFGCLAALMHFGLGCGVVIFIDARALAPEAEAMVGTVWLFPLGLLAIWLTSSVSLPIVLANSAFCGFAFAILLTFWLDRGAQD